MTSVASMFAAALNFWGIAQQPTYDAIVIGAGAGGCPLAQTLAEGGLKVLLVERGDEQPESSKTLSTGIDALTDVCAESFRSGDGVTVVTGNCMGGATSVNHGIIVQETPEWFQSTLTDGGSQMFSIAEIVAAYDWVRGRVAPEPVAEVPGSGSETYIKSLFNVFESRSDFADVNADPGQPFLDVGSAWRTHSTFHPVTGMRRSADTILDRNNANLDIRKKTKVASILFDGDLGVPLTAGYTAGDTPRARCVRFTSLEVVCVKAEGRIYISSGALHTPELLLKSGIGPSGKKVTNTEVGKNLNDKPALLLAGSFPPGFNNTGQITFSHIAAAQQGTSNTLLYEELSVGLAAMLPLAVWQRNYVPTSLRNSRFATAAAGLIKFCEKNLENPAIEVLGPSLLCAQVEPIVEAECDKRIFGIAVLLGDPTSRGSVTRDSLGRLKVNVNYMSTTSDIESLGALARVGFGIMTSLTGPAAPQTPCVDKNDEACMAMSCPDLIAAYEDYTKKTLKEVNPTAAEKLESAPASVIYPQFVEPALANSTDDITVGKLLREQIFAAHHLAGSAAMGSVVDGNFKVMGVEGLYVVDASALPITPRGNPMATVMAMGRIAGLHAVQDLTT